MDHVNLLEQPRMKELQERLDAHVGDTVLTIGRVCTSGYAGDFQPAHYNSPHSVHYRFKLGILAHGVIDVIPKRGFAEIDMLALPTISYIDDEHSRHTPHRGKLPIGLRAVLEPAPVQVWSRYEVSPKLEKRPSLEIRVGDEEINSTNWEDPFMPLWVDFLKERLIN